MSTDLDDYYVVLQVDPQAEPEVIQAAYRRLAAKYHPDVDASPQAEQRMKALNAAYEVLSNPDRRRAYDEGRAGGYGPPGQAQTPRRPFPVWLLLLGIGVLAVALRVNVRLFAILALLFLGLWLFWRPNLRT